MSDVREVHEGLYGRRERAVNSRGGGGGSSQAVLPIPFLIVIVTVGGGIIEGVLWSVGVLGCPILAPIVNFFVVVAVAIAVVEVDAVAFFLGRVWVVSKCFENQRKSGQAIREQFVQHNTM